MDRSQGQGTGTAMPKRCGALLLVVMITNACATDPVPSMVDRMSFVRSAPWVEVSSPRFEILSTMSEEDTKNLARDLERFHALIELITKASVPDPPIPTRIFAFKRRSEYRRFGESWTTGFFKPGVRANRIVLHDYSRDLGASAIILHEYVHYVVRNGTAVNYPIWYDEGFAEFLSTAQVFEDKMAIGAFPRERIQAFEYGRWVSMKRIISGKSYADFRREGVGMFYAEAWALVHYLTLDRGPGMSMSRDLARYLSLVEIGLSAEAAFEQAFGEPIEEVGKTIVERLRKGDWRVIGIPLAVLEYDRTDPVARVPSATEIAIHLGGLSLSVGDGAAAEGSFRSALALEPTNARAEAGLGDALKLQGRWEEAGSHFRRAVDLEPDDPFNHLDLAEYLHDLALEPDRAPRSAALLEEARRAYARSRDLDASIPETWAWYGKTFLAPGEDPSKSLEPIRHAVRMLPSSPEIVSLLAEALVATGDVARARRVLGKTVSVRGEGPLHDSLDEEIQSIRDRRAKAEEAFERARQAPASGESPEEIDD